MSTIKNLPSFTLSPRTDKQNKLVISSKHVQDQLGRDSPGVGSYQFDFAALSKSVLNKGKGGDEYSFGNGQKFFELNQIKTLKKEL